ncbi:PH domain-containing protein [Acrocarpospora pleiomorpha]|uniref:PH domain-containing protein n=1 Tax=Acrocarpospora pleiomorpha TaxID=90975 RepID=UPI001FE30273|nr:PH domain-containing protein [Acrocarpospora pleiomorpha]
MSDPAGPLPPSPPTARPVSRDALRAPAHQVSRHAITLWFIEGITGFIIMVGGAALLSLWVGSWTWLPDWLTARPWLVPLATALVLLPPVIIEPPLRFAVHRWELSADVVYARSGWLSREWVFVPVGRIQTVDKAQGWFERLLGLATVEIRTASYAGSSTIKGLDYEVAARLAEDLSHQAQQLRDDAT